MEIMWDIPFIPEPMAKPWHIPCPAVLQALIQNPNLPCTLPSTKSKKKKISDQRVRESKKERKFPIKPRKKTKRKFPIKDWEKAKGKKIPDQRSEENRRNMQEGLWTRQYLNNTELSPSKQEKKGNHDLKWSSPFDCQPKSCASVTCSPRAKPKQKRKSQKHTKAEEPTKRTHSQGKPYWSMITHVIFDLIWNNLQSQVMTYLWFGIRMKHLPVRDWYTLSGFLLFFSNPVFPPNGHLETKC